MSATRWRCWRRLRTGENVGRFFLGCGISYFRKKKKKKKEANTARRHRHVGGLGGSAGDGEGGESRGQDCRGSRPGGAGHHGTIEKVDRRRLASQRSSCALEASRGQWRPLVPPYPHRGSNRWLSQQEGSVFATALFVAAGFAGRPTGGIYRPGWCCIAAPMPRPPHLASLACSWRMASLRSSYRCAVRWCWLRAAWASGASERAAWRWRCCWPSGARVALASQLACT